MSTVLFWIMDHLSSKECSVIYLNVYVCHFKRLQLRYDYIYNLNIPKFITQSLTLNALMKGS